MTLDIVAALFALGSACMWPVWLMLRSPRPPRWPGLFRTLLVLGIVADSGAIFLLVTGPGGGR